MSLISPHMQVDSDDDVHQRIKSSYPAANKENESVDAFKCI